MASSADMPIGPWLEAAQRVLAVVLLALSAATQADEAALHYTAASKKPFDEVVADLDFAITEGNYRVTARNWIGEAIAKREATAFPRSAVLHFCNLSVAKQILELAPDYLLYMPCRVVAYENGDRVIVAAHLLPKDDPRVHDLSVRVNNLLKAIVLYAVE